MNTALTFGGWLKRRRGGLGLTQKELAQQVGYAEVTLRKVEADELRPSRQMAEKLAEVLQIAPEERAQFVRFARDELGMDAVALSTQTPAAIPQSLPTNLLPNISAHLRSLVGREKELADLDALMFDRNERLITITGPGGIGKTVLALAVAERYLSAGRFRNGVFVVSLAGIDTVTAIVPAVMTALTLQPAGGQASEAALKCQVLDYLCTRQMLLIFDNFEQLLAGGTLLAEILAAAPDVYLLVTSRERLHLHDEQVYPIGGLECPTSVADGDAPALALFLRTARRIRPHFQPNHDDLVHLVLICQLVTGMPLALELAAGWVRLLSPSAIAEALQTNLDLLTTTMHDMPTRHRSMRAAFDATWALLAGEERQVFAQLSVFRDGFTRAAAEQVAGATLKQLSALADKSLIEYRYRVDRFEVHELLRQYGAEKLLMSSGHEAASMRHLCYFLKLAETAEPHLRGADRARWMRSLENEHNNLRRAFDWAYTEGLAEQTSRLAGALTRYWIGHGAWLEGAHCIAAALSMRTSHIATTTASSVDPRLLAKVLYAAGLLAWHQSDYAHTKTYTNESLALCQQLADEFGSAQALHLLGITERAQRNFPQATQYFTLSLKLARKIEDKLLIAEILNDMGQVAWRQNDFVKARELFEDSLANHQFAQNSHGMALNSLNLGMVACWEGDLERAHTFGERSLTGFQQLADPLYIAQASGFLAIVAMYGDKLEQAQALLEQTLDSYRKLGAQRSIAITLLRLGHVHRRQGDLPIAGQFYCEATTMLQRIGDPLNLIYVIEGWIYLAVSQNKFATAALLCGAIAASRERLGIPRPPVEIPEYARHIDAIHKVLGEPILKSIWAEGSELSLEQALDYALSVQQPLPIAAGNQQHINSPTT